MVVVVVVVVGGGKENVLEPDLLYLSLLLSSFFLKRSISGLRVGLRLC